MDNVEASDSPIVKMVNDKIDEQMALAEFDRFTECMALDVDEDDLDSEDLTSFLKQKKRILKAIRRGTLVINEHGEAIYTCSNRRTVYDKPLVFHERTGASLMAMDGKKKNHEVSKTYAVMADMCKVHQSVFAKMVGEDIKICEALFALLMD